MSRRRFAPSAVVRRVGMGLAMATLGAGFTGSALAHTGHFGPRSQHRYNGQGGRGAQRGYGGYGGHGRPVLIPGNLLVSGSDYRTADIQPGVTPLPPDCQNSCTTANTDGAYPYVFNNDIVDGSFGVTSPIFLDELTPWGRRIATIRVPANRLVTSFSSKSELALNLSTDGRDVTFMGYVAKPGMLDVSNSNTPGVIDPTNPVGTAYYRAVAELTDAGRWHFTETNAYSGNNGRAAILNNAGNVFYTAGNAGNGSNPQPAGVVLGAGAQILSPSYLPEGDQSPGQPTPVGNFNVTELGDKADKVGKDDNFRGLTVYDNVVYLTKGSGGNGIDTVYFIDTSGTNASGNPDACPHGTGLPAAGAPLPTTPFSFDPSTGEPTNICILNGFPTTFPAKGTTHYPFGIWFANPDTLYVADEGSGAAPTPSNGVYTNATAAAQPNAGLEKWVFNASTGSWQQAYTLQSGLNLGTPYTVPGYPTGNNPATGLPWAPATDGLRNITGRVNRNGTVTIWAVTSTVSGSGDQGADPNKVVSITDQLGATTLPASETFATVRSARYGQVLRGVSLTPGS
jgi:hypothetical protein